MKRIVLVVCVLALAAGALLYILARPARAAAQTARGGAAAPARSSTSGTRGEAAQGPAVKNDTALRARILAFLNRSLGWQDLDKMEIESISAPDESGIRSVRVLLAKGDQHQEGTYFITPDEKEIIEGSKDTLAADPWAKVRAELETAGAPSEGAADAPVTIVEFSDLECPFCKEENATLKQLMQDDPGKFRVVFKYFPLVDIHPWSMQAAKEAYCVTQQHPAEFWNFADFVFAQQDNLEALSAATIKTRLDDFATESGAEPGPLHACMASPATTAAIDASIANGKKVGVLSTPTLFIDGRLIPGAVAEPQLRLLVDHEAGFAVHDAAGLTDGKLAGKQCGECKALPPIKH